ncbi:MAG: hypothetical protein IT336_10020, partial [Thermomicrobiales bacterium]|nr:hypothetical protein [Thermomicrobiales bacterium]
LPLFDRLLPQPERQIDIALSRELLERLRLQREIERSRQRLLHQGRMSPPLEPARREPTEPPATPSPAETTPTYRTPAEPAMRLLRAYAFDPSQETRLTTARINQVTIPTRWEPLKPGPVGEYLEVIDIDPASGCAYAPIDLDHPHVLAQDGLTPSEGDPQFHQQVVYAVAMNAIHRFERALGRPIFWAPLRPWLRDRTDESDWYTPESLRQIRSAPDRKRDRFVQRLRVYPHALREANAYYSPRKRSLLFGYFPGSTDDTGTHYPGGMVFTCLSHDIIVHETTHALLDGMLPYLNERSNEDVLAFHEAFADIMALFQHFTFREVLLHQIAHTRGDLRTDNLLGQLAQQFGEATGKRGALRNALGEIDPRDNTWKRHEPDPRKLRGMSEPHERGSILVAAVFDAFLALYNDRIADLLRLATGGTGVIPAGQIHPDLVNRLAAEAAQTAETVLEVCIRALDYLPPVEVTFGDFLRSLITADFELSPSERRHRIAFIEAFRSWGIYPRDISTLSEDSLRWRAPEGENGIFLLPGSMLQQFEPELDGLLDSIQAWNPQGTRAGVQPGGDRATMFNRMLNAQVALNRIIKLGQQTPPDQRLTIPGVDLSQKASFSISNLRLARRIGPLGDFRTEMMFTIVQTPRDLSGIPEGDIVPRGGATCIVDLRTWQVRYVVYKRLYEELPSASLPDGRLASRFASRTAAARGMAAWLGEGNQSLADQLAATYEGWSGGLTTREPFALLHRTMD